MTDQAPSFAEQLERASRAVYIAVEEPVARDISALLTRAAALARAAEDWHRLHEDWWQNGGERRGTGNRLVKLGQAEGKLRALVSAAGQGE